jgi:hypothetical protein
MANKKNIQNELRTQVITKKRNWANDRKTTLEPRPDGSGADLGEQREVITPPARKKKNDGK